MTSKVSAMLAIGLLVLVSLACNASFSTANLSEIKVGKDKDATGAGMKFKPEDEIFAVTGVNNASGKNKVKFRLLFDNVEGGQTGAVAYKLDKELEVDGSRPIWFNFSVPGGIVPGTYKAEAVLTSEDGKELDRKTGSFTVEGTAKAAKPEPDADDAPRKDTEEK